MKGVAVRGTGSGKHPSSLVFGREVKVKSRRFSPPKALRALMLHQGFLGMRSMRKSKAWHGMMRRMKRRRRRKRRMLWKRRERKRAEQWQGFFARVGSRSSGEGARRRRGAFWSYLLHSSPPSPFSPLS